MHDTWLSNRIFHDHDDIVAHCCHAWNRLIDQPWHIISIALQDRYMCSDQGEVALADLVVRPPASPVARGALSGSACPR